MKNQQVSCPRYRHYVCLLTFVSLACLSVSALLLFVQTQHYDITDIAARHGETGHEKMARIVNYTHHPVEERQRLMQEHIRATCRSKGIEGAMYDKYSLYFLPKYAIFNREHKLMFCGIPKAGVSSWKKVFLQLEGIYNGIFNSSADLHHYFVHHNDKQKYNYLRYSPYDERKNIVDTYLKFTSTRNPFERLLSAYRQKFEEKNVFNKGFRRKFGPKISARSRNFNSEEDTVTFPEFIDYILHQYKSHSFPNIHWAPMHKLCHPCHINYDMVVKFETLQADARHLLQLANISNIVEFPEGDTHATNSSHSAKLKYYYSQLNRETIDAIYRMYEPDFILYGYGYPKELLN
ncbi:carbohydrate sulfotransferase 11-like [Ptychodera flava]|uniref:carbohydrate sulfotransferase 11-like n=1 Tax=Ptychodera flava TaxID=63121 RepID=UPI003969C701